MASASVTTKNALDFTSSVSNIIHELRWVTVNQRFYVFSWNLYVGETGAQWLMGHSESVQIY